MEIAALPPDDKQRLETLLEYNILDTLPESDYDDIVELASNICGTPISLISLIDKDRQWFKARFGLDTKETSRDASFCTHAILQKDIFEVADTLLDKRFIDNPLVTGDPNIRFYAGVPLTMANGHSMGALCVIDTVPRKLNEMQRNMLRMLAKQVICLLELRLKLNMLNKTIEKVEQTNDELLEINDKLDKRSRELDELNTTKDKLFTIIGHDIRSPLAALINLIQMFDCQDITQEEFIIYTNKVRLSLGSLYSSLDNLLVWANAQMKGISQSKEVIDLHKLIENKISLFEEISKKKEISLSNHIPKDTKIYADINHIKVIFRNIISNALKFTSRGGSIEIKCKINGDFVEVAISDTGLGMSENILEDLFTSSVKSRKGTEHESGTGLGLLLCKDFLEKNNGKIWVESVLHQGSTFYITIPKG